VVDSVVSAAPGTLELRAGVPVIATGNGAVELVCVQRPSRKIISGREFAATLRNRTGSH
jgi:methionyl-tRNA formyltransferase